jgi:hypothetical protein
MEELKKLQKMIVQYSNKMRWFEARNEWKLYRTEPSLDENCLCGRTTTEYKVIRNMINGNRLMVCQSCIDNFNNDIANEDVNILCEVCDTYLKDKTIYKTHLESKTHLNKLTCNNCNKKFKNKLKKCNDNYYCKSCTLKNQRNCMDCKMTIGTITELKSYVNRCKKCYITHKHLTADPEVIIATFEKYAFISDDE